jgi:hypothetical protein
MVTGRGERPFAPTFLPILGLPLKENSYNEMMCRKGNPMVGIEITIRLPGALVKQATELGILSSEHIERLIRADIETQLANMANDPDIQHELRHLEDEFSITESDGLS